MDDLIATLTESDDVCRHFDGKDIVLGNSATHMTLPLLVSWLLARCRVVGPELCAENLCRFLDSDQLEGEEKLVVAGVMVGPNFSLMNGISLEQLPIEADSAQLN